MPDSPPRYGVTRPKQAENRPNARARGYTRTWEEARKHHLDANPLCVECEAAGRVTEATVVDHIIPHRGNRELFWDSTNWQSLCAPHHNRKTARGE